MTKQLTIDSDEAYELAHHLARERGCSVTEVVVAALRDMRNRLSQDDIAFSTAAMRQRYDELHEVARRTALTELPGATSDHSDMYDERGLPK